LGVSSLKRGKPDLEKVLARRREIAVAQIDKERHDLIVLLERGRELLIADKRSSPVKSMMRILPW
jgi:hypothetical protein